MSGFLPYAAPEMDLVRHKTEIKKDEIRLQEHPCWSGV